MKSESAAYHYIPERSVVFPFRRTSCSSSRTLTRRRSVRAAASSIRRVDRDTRASLRTSRTKQHEALTATGGTPRWQGGAEVTRLSAVLNEP